MAQQLELPTGFLVRRMEAGTRCPRCGKGPSAQTAGDSYALCDPRKGGCGKVYAR